MDKKLLAKLIAGIFGTAPFLAAISQSALAAGTDIASSPLANRRSSDVKPNLMLILDDSGSMMQDYMPDSVGNNDAYGPGWRNHLCNTIYYNPTPSNPSNSLSPYLVPRSDAGVNLNTADPASFTSAYDNGYWSYDQIGHLSGVAARSDLSADQGWGASYDANGKLYGSGQGGFYWTYLGSVAVQPISGVCGVYVSLTLNNLDTTGVCAATAVADRTKYSAIDDPSPSDAACVATYPGTLPDPPPTPTLVWTKLPSAATAVTVTGICAASAASTSGNYIAITDTVPNDAACVTANPATPTLIWKKVVVSATSSPTASYDERPRFANWYSYYRNRMQMTKSAIGRAFLPLIGKKKYRAGLITIAPQQLNNGVAQASVYSYDGSAAYNSKFLEIRNFDTNDLATNQPYRWFNLLYSQRPNGATPLREGLSRVGRYYAGMNDGPNTGMIPSSASDPVQYACQQNFSILTTDGYWDSPSGSIGGYKLAYATPMDNQDGVITETVTYIDDKGASQTLPVGARPVYDGSITSTETITDANNQYQNIACNYYIKTTLQTLQSTAQTLQNTDQSRFSTAQNLQNTSQNLQSTAQNLLSTAQIQQSTMQNQQSTNQNLKSTQQYLTSTEQDLQSTSQRLQNTSQNLKSTEQDLVSTSQLTQSTNQRLQSTEQDLRSTVLVQQNTNQLLRVVVQIQQSTSQNRKSTNQNLANITQIQQRTRQIRSNTLQLKKSTNQNLRSTTQIQLRTFQNRQSTSQKLTSTRQNLKSTGQILRTTLQNLQSTSQKLQSTRQALQTTSLNYQSTRQNLQSTTQNLLSTSQTLVRTSQLIKSTLQIRSCNGTGGGCVPSATCTPVTEVTVCSTVAAGPSTVSACVGTAASSGNSWITTTCSSATTGPTATATCTAVSASSGNSWVTTSCSTATAGPTGAATCTPVGASAGNSWVTTTCGTSITSSVAVASCTAAAAGSGNNWITTTCSTPTATNVAVATCTATGASAGNSWVTTTCSSASAGPSGVASCTATAASSGNSWVTTTCSTPTTTDVAAASCTATGASAGNSWITTTCSTVATSNVAVASCTTASAGSGNSWVTTTCSSVASGPSGVSSCTAAGASSGNSWVTTTCSTSITSNVASASCIGTSASSSNSWISTTCSTPITTNIAGASCTATGASAGNSWVTTTCSSVVSGPTGVATCTAVSGASTNSWVTTTCSSAVSGPTGVASCTAVSAASGNSWITTTCSTSITTSVAVASCAVTSASSGNSWIATTCGASVTTNVAGASCTAASAGSGNSWITTTCSSVASGPTGVQTCTPVSAASANSWVTTTCSTALGGPNGVAACSAVSASSGNSWVTTTCSTSIATNVAVASCTVTAASSGNSWVGTTCGSSVTTNVAAATCVATNASSGNSWITTTCNSVTGGPTGVQSCTPVGASSANSWITTTCATPTLSSTPVASCTPVSASSGNSWMTTLCVSSTTATSVATCTPVSASSGNSWIATTCSTTTTASVPMASCTVTSASAGNGWITTTCSLAVTTNVAVAACTPTGASSGNSWITTTCGSAVSGPTGVSSCAPVSASAGNSWVTTTCGTSITTNVPAGSCALTSASAGNSWIATTCASAITTGVASATCAATGASAGNSWITTTCGSAVTSSVAVAACTPTGASSGNSWITTTCSSAVTTNVAVAACAPVSASAGNGWVTTSCGSSVTTNVASATCTATGASAGNSWITTSCGTSIATNVPAATCSATSASSANGWVTTSCSNPVTTNVPTASCVAVSASAGNSWITTTCASAATNNVAVSACTPASAAPGNSWVTTTCGTSISGPTGFATCTPTAASAGNSWVATSCASAITTDVAVAICAATSAVAGNSWVTTTCAASIVANVPISSCSATSAASGNSWVTTTCGTSIAGPTPIAVCTPVAPSAGNSWITTTCDTVSVAPTGVASCTPGVDGSFVTTACGTSITTSVPVASCVATPASGGNQWITTTCDTTSSPLNSTDPLAQTCTVDPATAGNNFVFTDCTPPGGIVGSKNQYQTATSNSIKRYSDSVIVSTATNALGAYSSWTDTTLCLPAVPANPANGQPSPTDPANPPYTSFDGACTGWPCTHVDTTPTGGSSNSLADVAQYYYKTDLRPSGTTGYNGLDVSSNIVPSSTTDTAEGDVGKWQHMTTFTMGLGVSGTIAYNANYRNKPIGSFTAGVPDEAFQKIRCQDGSNAPLSDPNLCINWPIPMPKEPAPSTVDQAPGTRVDDLWHAAVGGRGQYFSAADPDAVFSGLQTALQAISAQSGAGTGASTSTQDPVPGDSLSFSAGFRTVDWTGDITAQELYTGTDLSKEGTVLPAVIWSTKTKLDGKVGSLCDSRTIHLLRMGATNNLTPFTWNTKVCDSSLVPTGLASTSLSASEQAYLTSDSPTYSSPFNMTSWSQYLDMTDGTSSTVDQRPLAQGANLVNFLRGQRGMEGFVSGSSTKLFRTRVNILGDIVGSQPRYVRAPSAQFTDVGYAAYKARSDISGRPKMLYVGANDGMLHAFKVGTSTSDAEGGTEAWAMIPSAVLPNLPRLADKEYSEAHTYYVDGTPSAYDAYDKYATVSVAGDCNGATDATTAKMCWKTLLVGGLGAGGRGYYAMDVTDPLTPKALWEFKWSDTCYDSSNPATHAADCHIGLTFGVPLVTKLPDGTWVVLATSGLNNINSPAKAGDGIGYLYVLDAITGKILHKLSTGVGSASTSNATLTGTLTLNGTTTVSGTSTVFTTELVSGQTIIVNGVTRVVQSVANDTTLTVTAAFPASANGTFGGTKITGTGASGFAHINAYVDNFIQDNTSERVYGGDGLGNVWRFDLTNLTGSGGSADVARLASLRDPNGNAQAITTAPQLVNTGATHTKMVFVGTGRYLGESDLSDTQVQTVYGLVENTDILSTTPQYGTNGNAVLPTAPLTLREHLNKIEHIIVSNSVETRTVGPTETTVTTVTTSISDPTDVFTTTSTFPTTPVATGTTTTVRTFGNRGANAPACSAQAAAAGIACAGWYADLPDAGERVNLDMRVVLGTLSVTSNVTNLTACDVGGNFWLSAYDAATGAAVPGSHGIIGRYMSGAIAVGVSFIRSQSGRILSIVTKSDGTQVVTEVPTQQGSPLGRRTSWRDLLGN